MVKEMDYQPQFLTLKQVARTGILSYSALRKLNKARKLPAIQVGNRTLVNFPLLLEQLSSLNRKENAI